MEANYQDRLIGEYVKLPLPELDILLPVPTTTVKYFVIASRQISPQDSGYSQPSPGLVPTQRTSCADLSLWEEVKNARRDSILNNVL